MTDALAKRIPQQHEVTSLFHSPLSALWPSPPTPLLGSVTFSKDIRLRIAINPDRDTRIRASQCRGAQLEPLPDATMSELPTGRAQPTHKQTDVIGADGSYWGSGSSGL